MARCMTSAELRAVLDPTGPRPAPYWPQAPNPGPPPEYEERVAYQREHGVPMPGYVAWLAYSKEAKRCWERRMRLAQTGGGRDG